LGYPEQLLNAVPAAAVEAFCGVANPFALRPLTESERIVDVGSGAGLDTFAAACQVGPTGLIIGVDMTSEMVARARTAATAPGWEKIEFREGLAESLPVETDWADAVISNGAINLCTDKHTVLTEIYRVIKPGGRLQFADIANGQTVTASEPKLWAA